MQILIITFCLDGVTPEEYAGLCEQTKGDFAAIPGLISKVYLADQDSNTYGGVYAFEDEAAVSAYKASSLYEFVATHPNLTEVKAREFGILEDPTRATRGLAHEVA